ncbi:Coproporphyrinogen oxidase [Epithele typhae]|uniref:Coproporphyrinogen oxidase n=1 Tax=Epithele typhae TaxID=378194 RepID=UPI002007665F|nr:Coproporphyrinogen oxidase [Epithele typhae]KAH9914891.1 Coproporphyrinogen oxidase [Epithele typhae]
MRQRVEEYISNLQDEIVAALEKVDPNAPAFKRDSWLRAQGGRGLSCVFAVPTPPDGVAPQHTVLEKAGVNISVVHGTLPPPAIKQMRADHSSIPDIQTSVPFFAAGISLVIHPRSPHAPTVHANYRYFEITKEPTDAQREAGQPGDLVAWWFGGGADLTPSYLYEEDAVHFHKTLKAACDAHGADVFPTFKAWCDEYFFIPHRGESRGVGGIFFDDLCAEPHKRLADGAARPKTADEIFAFVRAAGDAFVPSFVPVLERRCRMPSTEHERRWQLLRRGRYVEFNLVYDRGTKFGLVTPGARIESILMSLPETARWEYMSELGTDPESREGKLMEVLKTARAWV